MRPQRADDVGDGEGQAEAEHTEAVDEQQGKHDVEERSRDVDHERRARVLVGVEGAQHEQIDGEPAEPEREPGKGPRRRQRIRCGEVAVLERGADDRPAQDEQTERRRAW